MLIPRNLETSVADATERNLSRSLKIIMTALFLMAHGERNLIQIVFLCCCFFFVFSLTPFRDSLD